MRVAVVQLTSTDDLAANLRAAERGVRDAASAGARFVALPEMWPYLESGEVQVLLGQKYFEWGSESVRILKALREGRTYPRVLDSGYDLVTPQTLATYRLRWS